MKDGFFVFIVVATILVKWGQALSFALLILIYMPGIREKS
jgi:hypothetical protein